MIGTYLLISVRCSLVYVDDNESDDDYSDADDDDATTVFTVTLTEKL